MLGALGTTADRGSAAIEQLQAETKRLAREVSKLKVEGARSQQSLSPGAIEEAQFSGGKFVAHQAEGLGKDELRQLADAHRDRIKTGIVVIGSKGDGKLSLVVAVTKDLAPRVHAGQIVKQIAPIVGGTGGGRPDFAEAGGKDATQIPAALAEARRVAEGLLSM
jgi:alanyl-tRNA synthetase